MNLEEIEIKINALYDLCLEIKTPFHKKIDVCMVPQELVDKVLTTINIDIPKLSIVII